MRTEASISFLESQLIEIDTILKYVRYKIIYNQRRDSILQRLEYKYMISRFTDHKNTIEVMSRV